jgi:DNA-binding SARP family transcriptional activator/tetratricopeptide (TPR) repeat protein
VAGCSYACGVLTVGVLGPLEVTVGGRPVRLTSGRLRTLLVMLAMAAGSPLSVDRLAIALWDDELPDHVRRVVQTYLGRLRVALGEGLIVTEPAGYRLRVDPEHVDALRFTRLLDSAAVAPDAATERARLDKALALWRGGPFDDVESDWLARSEAPRLVERYLAAVERRIDLAAGDRPGELVARLQELTVLYPLRESLWVRLLAALDRSGRQAEALALYESIRRSLAKELGTEPGPELRQIHADLLAGKRPTPGPVWAAEPVVPRQLPADIDGFTGRSDALAALDAFAGEPAGHGPTAVVISAIAGTAGVGKTTLAVHWAHQVAGRFPDGQLYTNLRGFHPSGPASAPSEVIRGFLAALGVPPHQTPSDLDAQIGMYRSLLVGKRMLVLLDNARDSDQVRPLLPGGPTCLVLVTSRNPLTSLVAAEAARPLELDLLPAAEARELLARRLSADRVAAEPVATEEIIERCARLPLALAIAAAHAATRPEFPLSTIATQLRDESTRLDTLASEDPTTDTRAVFSWSYRALSAGAARLFRLLGLHPGPEVSAPAAASLAALPVGQARTLLTELHRAHLLTEHTAGRYSFHDLLRTYSAELAHEHEDATSRHAAQHRLLDHYLHTADAAGRLLSPHREPIAIAAPQPGVTPEDLAGQEHASDWYATEQHVLVAAIGHAATAGFDTHVWQLAWNITAFLHRRGAWYDWLATQQAALAAAQRLSDPLGQAVSHRGLARACSNLGRYEQAQSHLRQALELYERLGDRVGQAKTHHHLATLLALQDRYAEALPHCEQALDLHATAGHRLGVATVLNTTAWCHAKLGDHQRALERGKHAVDEFQQLADGIGEASTWDTLGHTHHQLGEHREAIRCYLRAIALFEKLGNRFFHADTLDNLGDAQLAAGEPEAARTAWQQALAMFDSSAQRQADQVRAKLRAIDRP